MEPTRTPHGPASTGGDALEGTAILAGALVGLGLLAAVAALRALLDREVADFDESAWVLPLFVGVLVAYAVAGWVAERRAARGRPLTYGALAGLGAFVAWVPLRVIVWVVRDEDRGIFRGDRAALRPGQVFGHLVIAAALGMLGAVLAAAARRRTHPR